MRNADFKYYVEGICKEIVDRRFFVLQQHLEAKGFAVSCRKSRGAYVFKANRGKKTCVELRSYAQIFVLNVRSIFTNEIGEILDCINPYWFNITSGNKNLAQKKVPYLVDTPPQARLYLLEKPYPYECTKEAGITPLFFVNLYDGVNTHSVSAGLFQETLVGISADRQYIFLADKHKAPLFEDAFLNEISFDTIDTIHYEHLYQNPYLNWGYNELLKTRLKI